MTVRKIDLHKFNKSLERLLENMYKEEAVNSNTFINVKDINFHYNNNPKEISSNKINVDAVEEVKGAEVIEENSKEIKIVNEYQGSENEEIKTQNNIKNHENEEMEQHKDFSKKKIKEQMEKLKQIIKGEVKK